MSESRTDLASDASSAAIVAHDQIVRIALLGNPNTGKTTLFNRLSGLRHKTSNFPGTTLETRLTRVKAGVEGGRDGDLVDLPGIYSLELEQIESRMCREVLAGQAAPRGETLGVPEVCVVVADATNLARNLMLVGEVFRRRLPTVVVLNMVDLAAKQGLVLQPDVLAENLGCEVVCTNARDGTGVDAVRHAIRRARIPAPKVPVPSTVETLRGWADQMYLASIKEPEPMYGLKESFSDRLDRILLHPLLGSLVFASIMTALFYLIFNIARYPMDAIIWIFEELSTLVRTFMPPGILQDLLANGVVAGLGSTIGFVPQICLLFFLISLLEDTGYLARASFVMDRLFRPFGLPGHAFVPLLSSHACALPGIMATRAIPDPRQRLATILVAPFMTCSARLPVYILLTGLLFPGDSLKAAVAFIGCYALGAAAAVFSALVARRTILRGEARPMAMELPSYKYPSLRTAFLSSLDRGWIFLKNAGTLILALSVILWWLGAYPKVDPPPQAVQLRQLAEPLTADDQTLPAQPGLEFAAGLTRAQALSQADEIEARHQSARSFTGRIGKAVEPVFAPMDWDWRVCVGVMSSFAAREVFVATMSVVVAGEENDDAEDQKLLDSMRSATRDDGKTLLFTSKVSWSLLVFYVLAMQCLPTLAVTARETGGGKTGFKWAALQFSWMSLVAYSAALIISRIVS